ncbi:MAG: DUF3854 domain-containing protein [Leptolyngbyaceae cyanobacterium SM1_4_3]|nr:DUF3854 domain-containing protein [Leptolyngbyaceae cyanobacterium SM1_4_3]
MLEHPEIPLFLNEGSKKGGCLLSHAYAAIASPGVTMFYRTVKDSSGRVVDRYLHPKLQPFVVGRVFYLTFDQDEKEKTRLNTRIAVAQTARLLLAAGAAQVLIVQWEPGLGKGVDDVIFTHGPERFEQAVEAALTYEQWRKWDDWRLDTRPSLRVCDRYLNFQIPQHEPIVALKSVQGTGKTELIANHVEKQREERPIFVLTHRESLAQALASRFNVPYRTEKCAEGRLFGYSLCIDSLHAGRGFRLEDISQKPCLVIRR